MSARVGRRPVVVRSERGLALVLTLFVVALVAILVLEYHFDAAVEIDIANNYANDVQAYHLALAGVRFAQALLQRTDPKAHGQDDSWYKLGLVPACFSPQQLIDLAATSLGEGQTLESADSKALNERRPLDTRAGDSGCVSLRITDENSKLPINALMPPTNDENQQPPAIWVSVFQKFFESFKIDPDVVDALVDWIDDGDNARGTGGAEKAHYTSLPIPYEPPNKRMRTPGELRLIKGLDDPETLAKLFPGAPPESVTDLDLGSNSYLTPFGAEQPLQVQPPPQQPLPPGRPRTPPAQPPPAGNQTAKVNLNTAPAEVIKALFAGAVPERGSTDAEVEELVAKRQDKKLKSLNDAVSDQNLRTKLGQVADVKSTHFRIESVGVVGVVQKRIVAVLKPYGAQQSSPAGAQPAPVNRTTMLYFKVE